MRRRPTEPDAADHGGGRRVSIAAVAARAGVSPTTVSHALSGARSVAPATRERVIRAADELGYTPNRVASGLRRQRSGVIGLASDRIATTPFAGLIVQGAQEAARERDAVLMVVDSEGDPELEARQLRTVVDHRVDGILMARMFHQEVRRPEALGSTPVVLVDAVPERGWHVPSIAPEEHSIATLAVAHLIEQGHRRIGLVMTTDDSLASRGREAGFHTALAEAGLGGTAPLVERGSSDAAGGRAAGRRLLDRRSNDRPTAVFCFNDQMAMGVYQAASALGLAVPADCSVVGVDDLGIVAAALDPGLTTVALPHREMGRWGMATLLDLVAGEGAGHGEGEGAREGGGEAADGPAPEPEPVLLRCELVERGSVAPPPDPRLRR